MELIKSMDPAERPREKVIAGGIKSLSNAELMALLFATGIKGKSVIELCNDILRDNRNHLSLVTKMSVKELCSKYKGIGPAKAVTLLAALELGARSISDEQSMSDPQIMSSKIAYEIMRPRFQRLDHEEFWVLYLNRSNRIISEERISQGGVTATVVDVKIILRYAIERLASSMIVFHNHPSGSEKPSTADDKLTNNIKQGAAYIDVRLFDHIIYTDKSYFSYADNDRL